MGLLDAAQHDGLMHVVFLEGLDQFVELADLDPMDAIDMAGQVGIRLAFMGDSGNLIPELPGIIGKNNGEAAVAGDQSEPFSTADLRRLRHRCHSSFSWSFPTARQIPRLVPSRNASTAITSG